MVQRISSAVFIGRAGELARARASMVCAVESGKGGVLLVSGEAGIGKSRFCAEVSEQASLDGWLVLRGACDEFGATARPFSALAEMVPAIERFLVSHAPAEVERPAWRALEALGAGVEIPPGTGSLGQLALDLFRRLAAQQPLLLVFDDLHWADESTRGLFGVLARGLANSRTLLVGAYRANEVIAGHPLRAVLGAVHRNTHPESVNLSPFGHADVEQLLQGVNREAGQAQIASLLERSGGNPFFLEELLASPEGELPNGIADVVLARLEALGPDALHVAQMAALDTTTHREVLAEIVALPSASFAAAVDALAAAGILTLGGDDVGFRHALIREVLYDQLPPMRRAALHEALALALESHGRVTASASAAHWQRSGNKPRALEAALAAARYTYSVGATPESADWYETAFRLWGDVPDAEVIAGRSAGETALVADLAFAACRRFDRTIEVLRECLETPSRESIAVRARLWLRLSYRAWQASGNEAVTHPLAVSAFREARGLLDEEMSSADRVQLTCNYIVHAIARYGLDQEAAYLFAAIRPLLPAQPIDPDAKGAAWGILQQDGDPALVTAIRGDASALERRPPSEYNEGGMLTSLGAHELNIERSPVRAANALEYGQANNVGIAIDVHWSLSLSAVGRWREALERWEATSARVGPEVLRDWAAPVVQGWAALLIRAGRADEAREPIRIAAGECIHFPLPAFLGPVALARVELARQAGDTAAACLAVNESIEGVRGHHTASLGQPIAYAIGLLADEADARSPTDPDTLALVDHWFERLQSCLDFAPGRVNLFDLGVFMDQARAERARLIGDDRAETWEDLVRRWHALPRPYHEAYCRLRAASALLVAPAAGERTAARKRANEHLDQSARITDTLGAVYLAEDIARLRRAAGLRRTVGAPAIAAQKPAAVPPILTSREVEVLRLVAAGESNGQIALRLGISVKTAGVHVSNILRKLDAANRVDAAMRASRLGLIGTRV